MASLEEIGSTSLKAFKTYVALKLHFAGSFDYHSYGPNPKSTIESLERRPDRFDFARLARMGDVEDRVVASLILNREAYVKEIVSDRGTETYMARRRRVEAITRTVEVEAAKMMDDLNAELRPVDGGHPPLLRRLIGGHVSHETVIAMDRCLSFLDLWERRIEDRRVWPERLLALRRSAGFLSSDSAKIKAVLRARWVS